MNCNCAGLYLSILLLEIFVQLNYCVFFSFFFFNEAKSNDLALSQCLILVDIRNLCFVIINRLTGFAVTEVVFPEGN